MALNSVLTVSAVVWLVTQTTKFLTARAVGRSSKFTDTGGMPSSHAAVISAAATVIGLSQGLSSPLFGLAVVVAAIVINDAVRVRWAAGETAERVNELATRSKTRLAPLAVYRGHRPLEVIIGIGFGVVLGILFYHWFYGAALPAPAQSIPALKPYGG